MHPAYRPKQFVPVRAYLLEKDVGLKRTLLLGLHALKTEFGLVLGPDGDFICSREPDVRIPIDFDSSFCDPNDPQFPIPRIKVGILFEPNEPVPDASVFFDGAIVDTGAPYLVIPYDFHKSGRLRIRRELGQHLFRVPSMGQPVFQPFVEVGIRFFCSS
jgi:hypothetical protein